METTKKKSFVLGYSLVLHSLLTFFFSSGLTNSGLNVIVPAFVQKFGWARGTLMTFSTMGGLISAFASILFAQWVMKKGPRIVTTIAFILGGLNMTIMGRAGNLVTYMLCVICIHLFSQGYSLVTTNTLIASWFPKKKGVIMGITTIGMPLSSVLLVPLLNYLNRGYGITVCLTVIGCMMIVLGIISWFWIRNTPESVGLSPDNIPATEEEIAAAANKQKAYVSQWTFKKLLKNRNGVLISLVFGLLFLVTQGLVSQMVLFLVENGYQQPVAVRTLSTAATCGIVGSFIWGLLDQKFGTKRITILYEVWYIISFALLVFCKSSNPLFFVGIVMAGFGLGGVGNLMPSMIVSVFGRMEFASVNRLVNPVVTVIRVFNYMIVGMGFDLSGSYKGAYTALFVSIVVSLILTIFIHYKEASPPTEG
jgi:sugar phosphate permease